MDIVCNVLKVALNVRINLNVLYVIQKNNWNIQKDFSCSTNNGENTSTNDGESTSTNNGESTSTNNGESTSTNNGDNHN
ncbi:hypothetical protein IMG5_163360 [Ichthyophthirius multifiliis]|uniref:Uncharacterized protein n=1 Tax=Ichthyophthirius multifiliis TaxID=5932 RepID=G0R0B8_ICHMU|nr:hypothetical protein IMG5_163360 [Ichthyophthirius multifiliis]EGR29080.1 hypothetical protein IMG5_163360 [Ichthyophthirius multifiliis]|eukprot:XP_004030316.1 hypothetical protein IMG5_163360 [Ichthyophthirius multifiliis]